MTTLERGFKAWAERTAQAIRRDLGLSTTEPLDPRKLARHLGVRLLSPEDLNGLPADILGQLFDNDPWGWSAATLQLPTRTIIIYNAKRSSGRQASDIVHELAHLILGHDPARLVLSENGVFAIRNFDAKQEDEANWLGWSLLLPRDALMSASRARIEPAEIAETYGVTSTLVNYRLRMTGVNTQMRRTRFAKGA
jgi:Zn-dependent peptidase ImmA (M78 family)